MNIMALRLKCYHETPSNISMPSFHKVFIYCIRGSRKTSISMPGCLGPYTRTDSKRYFLFWHNHIGRLYVVNMTSLAMCCGSCFFHQMNSFHPYLTRTEHSLGPFQILLLIKFLPLPSISWMSELSFILLALI